jgi:hypothetical protein
MSQALQLHRDIHGCSSSGDSFYEPNPYELINQVNVDMIKWTGRSAKRPRERDPAADEEAQAVRQRSRSRESDYQRHVRQLIADAHKNEKHTSAAAIARVKLVVIDKFGHATRADHLHDVVYCPWTTGDATDVPRQPREGTVYATYRPKGANSDVFDGGFVAIDGTTRNRADARDKLSYKNIVVIPWDQCWRAVHDVAV